MKKEKPTQNKNKHRATKYIVRRVHCWFRGEYEIFEIPISKDNSALSLGDLEFTVGTRYIYFNPGTNYALSGHAMSGCIYPAEQLSYSSTINDYKFNMLWNLYRKCDVNS